MKLSTKAKQSLDKVIDQFKSGDLSPLVEIIKIDRQEGDHFPALKWSLSNKLIAFMQSGGQLDCRGFRQWESAGRQVKKGGRAVFILAPLMFKKEDEDTGEQKNVIRGFRAMPVFPVDQTEGDPLPVFDYAPEELPPLWDAAKRLGVSVEYGPIEGPVRGSYYSAKKHIRLGVEHSKTFYHELAHAAHDKVDGLRGDKGEVETVAEFTAAVLQELYGEPTSGNAWQYISSYCPDDPLTAIVRAVSTVEKVLAVILDGEEEAVLEAA